MVPVFNEAQRIRHTGPKLADFVASYGTTSELIVVDDGSSDGTCEEVVRLTGTHAAGGQVRLARRAHHGKGAAVQAGLNAAKGTLAGFCDVDLATPLDELERLFAAAGSAPALVIGSRAVGSATLVQRQSFRRETLGRAYNRLLRATLTPGVHDTQCGAKAAGVAVWREILPYCREQGFAWDVEVVAVARRRGIAVEEMGVRWSHDAETRVHPLRDGA
ncbi:MAG: glycosyltransferase, partial [Acidimicrobiales bacterium]